MTSWVPEGERFFEMTRSELVERIAGVADLDVNAAKYAVGIVLEAISESLARGDRVELRGFGAFSVRERAAREGRNPRTGERLAVEAKTVLHFKTGQLLDRILNDDPEAMAAFLAKREVLARRRDERSGQLRLL
jgi:integration host factor beta subunit